MRLRPPAAGLFASLVLTAPFLTACTIGSGPSSPSTPVVTRTSTPPPSAVPPVSTGPTTAATATTCPLVTKTFIRDTMGMRLGRVTQLRSAGKVVGCRFYALQGGSLHASEHLPGPNQPAVEITTQRYPSTAAAHNAFVLRAGAAKSVTQTDLGGVIGLCFQNVFDPRDKGQDWACTVNKGAVLVLVRTVDTTGTFSTATVTTTVLRAVTG